jgi:hypothetical protein
MKPAERPKTRPNTRGPFWKPKGNISCRPPKEIEEKNKYTRLPDGISPFLNSQS